MIFASQQGTNQHAGKGQGSGNDAQEDETRAEMDQGQPESAQKLWQADPAKRDAEDSGEERDYAQGRHGQSHKGKYGFRQVESRRSHGMIASAWRQRAEPGRASR